MLYYIVEENMNFKTNKLILFCNRRITMQIARNWNNSEYVKALLSTVDVQAKNDDLSDVDFKNIINYIIYTLGGYYRGNMIFVFQILVAFLYLITPVDLINDFIPAIGYLDDLMLINMILSKYNSELLAFNKTKREILDIKYMRVDPKIIDDFNVDPMTAVELIIKDRKLEEVKGEELINQMIAEREQMAVTDYFDIDVIEILKYELINYLLKSNDNQQYIDEELLISLVQIPNVVTKKDVSYFLKNIEEMFSNQDFSYERSKKTRFSTNGINIKFDVESLVILDQLNFVQTATDYNNLQQQVIKYETRNKSKIDYELIVEIIDLATKKHLFADTTLYFQINLNDEQVEYKVDKCNKQVSFITSININNVLKDQLQIVADIIKERVM